MFIAASVLTMGGLTSCSNENDVQMEQPGAEKGVPTAMTLTIDMKGVSTRADQNLGNLDPADFTTVEETALKTLDVYIYDTKTGILDQHHPLVAADLTTVGNVHTTKALKAFTGDKKVYVGLNLTDAMKAVMAKSTLQVLETSAVTETLANMTDATTGFSMFCPDGAAKTFVEATEAEAGNLNKVQINVERMVAKIGIGAKAAPTQLGAAGILGALQFVVDNMGKKFYMPYTQADPSMTADAWVGTDFVFYDFNNDGNPAGVTTPVPANVWQNVVQDADQKNWKTAYSTENYVNDNKLEGMTRVVVRATFIPKQALTYTLEDAGTLTAAQAAIAAGATYYQLDVPGDNKFVFLSALPTETGVKAYYKAVTGGDYAVAGGDIMKDCVKTYTGGNHYWWVTMAEKGQEGNVERNHVYLANIKNISLPGRPDGEFDPDKDKDEELDKETNIEVEVTVLDWYMVDFDTDLKP